MGGTPMLTTTDNPYNPFTDFVRWLMFDNEHGYGTCELLARLCKTASGFSEEENLIEMEVACNEIIRNDFRGIYKKVYDESSYEN